MIKELTKKQEEMIPVYVDRYINLAYSTVYRKKEEVVPIVNSIYKHILLKPEPKKIYLMDSPVAAWTVFLELDGKVNHIPDLDKLIEKKTGSELRKVLRSRLSQNNSNFVWPYLDGKFSVNIFALYDYFHEVCGIDLGKKTENYKIWRETIKVELIYPGDEVCVVSNNFQEIYQNDNKQLHKDGGPALQYADGFSVYCLNGVRVSKEIAETPAKKLDPAIILKEKNAEVRREIVRKIGIERICEKLGAKVIDKGTDHAGQPCELLLLDLQDGRKRPYIKLINPSIGTYHVEGVHPDCNTLEKAFRFRNGTDQKPITLT